jgi:membrane fusion protein (multidrug efflux system)
VATRRDLHIEAEISSEDAAKAEPGMPVTVTSPSRPGQALNAKVVSLSPVGELKPDAAIRTRIVRARVMLEKDWELFRPGMEVDVQGERVLKRALAVPNDALAFSGESAVVFVVERDGVARSRPVVVGMSNARLTEIVSGLRAGERVVVDGKDELKDGDRVRVRG